jgi:hypothetical protein
MKEKNSKSHNNVSREHLLSVAKDIGIILVVDNPKVGDKMLEIDKTFRHSKLSIVCCIEPVDPGLDHKEN